MSSIPKIEMQGKYGKYWINVANDGGNVMKFSVFFRPDNDENFDRIIIVKKNDAISWERILQKCKEVIREHEQRYGELLDFQKQLAQEFAQGI